MLMQETGEDKIRRQGEADEEEGTEGSPGGGGGDEGDGDEGHGAARDGGETDTARDDTWREIMRECSESEDGEGRSSDDVGEAAPVGVGRAWERAGPGKWRRVATLARDGSHRQEHICCHT